jgi:hypothetical protein
MHRSDTLLRRGGAIVNSDYSFRLGAFHTVNTTQTASEGLEVQLA